MKTKSNVILIAILALVLSSCGKIDISPDDDNGSSNADPKISGSMKATLDGKAWEAKKLSFGGALALIQINGSIDDDNLISIELDDSKLKLNTSYELGSESSKQELQSLIVKVKGNVYFGNSGTLKITKYTKGKTVEGELNALLWDGINPEIKLENCKFSMTYK
ncbi:hypothetical protein EGI22_22945 [Lacihabitans sp. LS3-19]|uniref:hypothetical protein n=1 Tax=Lacihabitans sp. LS3-19 TaxID=2487335 RepID=UPI0020CCA7AF|nr:hypothetical protein [Lacihabitans sp. LS3-19]MCP9770772.1 hypothetical protein [Lacihabitans sp. LS3-19]